MGWREVLMMMSYILLIQFIKTWRIGFFPLIYLKQAGKGLQEEGTSQSGSFQETVQTHNTGGHRHARHFQRVSGSHNCNHTPALHRSHSSQSSSVSCCPSRMRICCILASTTERWSPQTPYRSQRGGLTKLETESMFSPSDLPVSKEIVVSTFDWREVILNAVAIRFNGFFFHSKQMLKQTLADYNHFNFASYRSPHAASRGTPPWWLQHRSQSRFCKALLPEWSSCRWTSQTCRRRAGLPHGRIWWVCS